MRKTRLRGIENGNWTNCETRKFRDDKTAKSSENKNSVYDLARNFESNLVEKGGE